MTRELFDQLFGAGFLLLVVGIVVYSLVTGEVPRRKQFGPVVRAERPRAYWGYLVMMITVAAITSYAFLIPR